MYEGVYQKAPSRLTPQQVHEVQENSRAGIVVTLRRWLFVSTVLRGILSLVGLEGARCETCNSVLS